MRPIGLESSTSTERLAHDARNVISGLMLYCELLAAPGVLTEQYGHCAGELATIVDRAARMLERMVENAQATQADAFGSSQKLPAASAVQIPTVPVTNAAEELRRLQPLLAAIAGPGIRLSIATMPCAGRAALAVEDLTRILVNLVRNAADAMPAGGHIRITAQYGDGLSFLASSPESFNGAAFASPRRVVLSVTDDGPGIPEPLRAGIFDLGFTIGKETGWPAPRRRGLGLSIVRHLVEAAGGTVRAIPAQTRGARFEISLPIKSSAVDSSAIASSVASTANDSITSGTYAARPNCAFAADGREIGCIECE